MSKKPYRLLASLLLMLVATLTSCEKFSIDETTGKSREANANVTIHVQKIEGISLLTTKAADKQMALGDVCSRLTLAIFDGEEKLETVNQLSTDNGFGTAYVSLDEGEYRLVVIAHNGKGNCSVSAPEKVKFCEQQAYRHLLLLRQVERKRRGRHHKHQPEASSWRLQVTYYRRNHSRRNQKHQVLLYRRQQHPGCNHRIRLREQPSDREFQYERWRQRLYRLHLPT